MSEGTRVVIVQRKLAHFRRAFLERLARQLAPGSLEVFHSGALEGGEPAPIPGVRLRRGRGFGARSDSGFDLFAQPGVAWSVIREAPDVVVLEGTFGVVTNMLIAAVRRLQRRRTFYWVCGWEKPGLDEGRRRVKRAFVRGLLRLADGAIVYGSASRDYVEAHGMPASRVAIAQNTIDVESILAERGVWRGRGSALRDAILPGAKRVIVYVGRLDRAKRVHVLLEAFAELRSQWDDAGLLVVGDGPAAGDLRARVRSQDIQGVHFAGAVRDGVEAWFAAGDVFVLPGIGGLALNQAMALGLPVVSSDADGTGSDLVVPGQNGELIPMDDPDALREVLAALLADPARAARMGERSAELIAERASLTGMVAAFARALELGRAEQA
jgi:glycosyltransferase involved in cell wall biosynthesis